MLCMTHCVQRNSGTLDVTESLLRKQSTGRKGERTVLRHAQHDLPILSPASRDCGFARSSQNPSCWPGQIL
ncbi:hypothetical protein Pla52n_12860 [Stieleria varia]|uniref:Uncharacterized protein n=1 Tax=Stieleria varia TaxID=2528005 RepID=A0A5C6B2D3_9BACT|nr:hypothetical protein Pla52n_12860 [Stieleria varia]